MQTSFKTCIAFKTFLPMLQAELYLPLANPNLKFRLNALDYLPVLEDQSIKIILSFKFKHVLKLLH